MEASGAGQGSLYHHFKGKFDLAATALREVEGEKTARAAAVLNADLPPLKRVEAYLTLERDALKGCPLGRLAYEPDITDSALRDPVENHFSFVTGELARVLHEAQRDGDLVHSLDVRELAAALFATLQGGYVLARALQDPEALARAVHGALALLNAAKTSQPVGEAQDAG